MMLDSFQSKSYGVDFLLSNLPVTQSVKFKTALKAPPLKHTTRASG